MVLPTDRPLRVAVIGAGLMGAQIGCEYALGGHQVVVVARRPQLARRRIEHALGAAERSDRYSTAATAEARSRLDVVPSPGGIAPSADLIVESIVEDLSQKVDVLGVVASELPEAILATNTSSLSVSRLGEQIGAPERTLGTHYWNPPLFMPLVELVPGSDTRPEVVDAMEETLVGLGKHPVRVRDVAGFAGNRLQYALLREAVWLVENDVATPDAVDTILRMGLGRRWSLTGPFETVALGGVETFERVAANLKCFRFSARMKRKHFTGSRSPSRRKPRWLLRNSA